MGYVGLPLAVEFGKKRSVIAYDKSNERIKALIDKGLKIKHVIIRHGLTEKEAFEVDASLIDFSNKFQYVLTNQVDGHHSGERGRICFLQRKKTIHETS